jgi:class 3 adenylate cyclase
VVDTPDLRRTDRHDENTIRYRVHTTNIADHIPASIPVLTYRDYFTEYRAHPEYKALGRRGHRCHAWTRGLLNTAGDGFFATFEGPARAVRCAQEIIVAVRPLGMEVRAGIHTGECVTIDGKMGGIAVSIGARVGASAARSEVLVSQTVRDLVAGSGLTFHDRGERELKGIPDRWRLYAAIDA